MVGIKSGAQRSSIVTGGGLVFVGRADGHFGHIAEADDIVVTLGARFPIT